MTATTRLYTLFYGQFVGADQFGNRYFTEKKKAKTPAISRVIKKDDTNSPQ